jgi:putative PIN family toxin of toxin-antitoxin system
VSRLVVDTNIVVSSFLTTGSPRRVLNRIRDKKDHLCISQPILREYLGVLARAGVSRELMASFLSLFEDPDRIILVVPSRRIAVIREDPPDTMFVECAVEARADYIISGDRHLKRLRTFEGIEILAPSEYLARAETS